METFEIKQENDDFLPNELKDMSESSKHCVIAYCILFLIGITGNLFVLLSVKKQDKKQKSRITLLIVHLAIADLIVCCTLIPTEVFWRLTIQWRGGNVLCKAMQFLRAFGLHLSSMVVICVSFDRFFAILYPLKMINGQGHQRIKVMLWLAWIASTTFSVPQTFLFSLASHPEFPSFKQCVTNKFLKNTQDVRMYSIFSVSAMYFVPLLVIIFTYAAILIKIIRKANQHNLLVRTVEQQLQQENLTWHRQFIRFVMSLRNISDLTIDLTDVENKRFSAQQPHHPNQGVSSQSNVSEIVSIAMANDRNKNLVLRRTENAVLQMTRARTRTFVMTIVIVMMFVLCWTPYVVMTLWYMLDWEGAKEVDSRIQDGLFVMAVANSCVNPLIYGTFTKNCCGLSKLFDSIWPSR